MANYQNLMAAISAVIKTNNRREITGQILQNVLNEMVGSLGENMQLTGFANPLTNPGTPDQNIFYFATQAGIYHHFDDIELDDGFSVLMWKNGQWTANTLEIAVTRQWVQNNFVSIEFFRKMFRAYDSGGAEVVPNDVQGVIDNIKAMCGMWTEQYLTALGLGSGGGGSFARYLNDLLDVTITNVQNGQALIYNSTLQQWVNGTAGVDMATVWSNLAGATSEQVNISHLTGALSGYATTDSLTQQINSTKTWVSSNFITIAYFDRLFRAYNGSTLVSHNDTTSTIDNIKAMFGFWTDFYLSALGTGGISTVGIGLSQLNDVTLTSPTGGQALVYDATSNKWVNGTIQTGVSTLSSLTDVLLTSQTANQVLIWDATSSKWVNTSLKTINYQSIIGSGDISVGGGASGNYLPLSGGSLYNANTDWIFNAYAQKSGNHASAFLADGNGYGIWVGVSSVNQGHYIAEFRRNTTGNGTGGKSVLSVYDNGGVGINLDNNVLPQYDLDINGVARSQYVLFYNTTMSSDAGYIGRGASGNNNIQICSYTGDKISIEASGGIKFLTKMFYNSSPSLGSLDVGTVAFPACGTTSVSSLSDAGYGTYFWADYWSGCGCFQSGYSNGDTTPLSLSLQPLGGNVGIGTINPSCTLDIIGYSQTDYVLFHNTSRSSAAGFVGRGSNSHNSIYLQAYSGNILILGANNDNVMYIDTNRYVGIGVSSPSYKLHVSGDIYATGGVTALSDIRHKTIINPTVLQVEQIAKMPAVVYKWNDGREDKELHVGSIAQNWQTVLPEVVLKANDEEGTLSMQYGVAALVSSIIIARKVVNHEERIKQLEKENKELKERLKIA